VTERDHNSYVSVMMSPVSRIHTERQNMNCFYRAIDWLDALDKFCSRKLQEANSMFIELLLIVFAHAFNRNWGVLGVFYAIPAGAFRYDVLLHTLGYIVPPAEDVTPMD